MLIELALRGRLQLEACGMRRKSLLTRKVRGVLNKYILIKEFMLPKMKSFSNSFQKLKRKLILKLNLHYIMILYVFCILGFLVLCS